MKEFLAWWITIQLLVVGGAVGLARYETSTGEYSCHSSHFHDELIGMLFPLFVFVPPDLVIEEYCKGKR